MRISLNKIYGYSMKFAYILSFTLLIPLSARAIAIKEVWVYSKVMKTSLPVTIMLPKNYNLDTNAHFPVIYLLHGYSGTYKTFTKGYTDTKSMVDSLGIILVCPDGGFDSYYIDSPVDSTKKFESYIIKELVPFIDSSFRTIPKAGKRGIVGLSMGGHGALFLALRNQDIFGVAGSMSGIVDLSLSTKPDVIAKILGKKDVYPDNWINYSVKGIVNSLKAPVKIHIRLDCGIDDTYVKVNREFNKLLISKYIIHEYMEYPGQHNKEYWIKALPKQILFINDSFNEIENNDYQDKE